MSSPRSGFRRARAASWTLAGLGVAGVAGASTLAYADTFKPPAVDPPMYAVDAPAPELPAGAELPPALTPDLPPPPPPADVVTTTAAAPPPLVVTQEPTQTYSPRRTVQQAQAPAATQSAAPTSKTFTATTRSRPTQVMVMPARAVPHVTASHGS